MLMMNGYVEKFFGCRLIGLFSLLAPLDLLDGSVKVLFLIGGFKPVSNQESRRNEVRKIQCSKKIQLCEIKAESKL